MTETRIFNPLSVAIYIILIAIYTLQIDNLSQFDFIQYWSAAREFADNKNPYDSEKLASIQQATFSKLGISRESSILYATPICLPLVYFLNWFDYSEAKTVWLLVSLTLIYWPTWIFFYKNTARLDRRSLLLFIISAFTFSPFYSAIFYGQISWLIYIGWVGFLLLYSQLPLLAGLALSLTLIKPHLLYLIYLLLILGLKQDRCRRTLLGLLLGAFGLTLCAIAVNEEILRSYLAFSARPPIFWKTINLGSWLQSFSDTHKIFIRFLPTGLTAFAFAVFLYRKKSLKHCNDCTFLALLAPLSILTAPYGWLYDCVLAFPLLAIIIGFRHLELQQNICVVAILVAATAVQIAIGSSISQQGLIWYLCILVLIAAFSLRQQLNREKSADFPR